MNVAETDATWHHAKVLQAKKGFVDEDQKWGSPSSMPGFQQLGMAVSICP